MESMIPVILAAMLAVPSQAAEKNPQEKRGRTGKEASKKGSHPYYLGLLSQWEKHPDGMRQFYEAAFRVLNANPDAAFADLAEDAEVRRLAEENGVVHLGGPMLGCVHPRGASVWLRTLRPAKVEVRVSVNGAEKPFGPVESTPATDLTAVVPVTGLEPGTSHPYRVLVDGRPLPLPEHAAIVTTPGDARPAKVRIVFGSCWHVWGLGNPKQAEAIRSRKAAALLTYGDIAAQDNGKHRGLMRTGYLVRDAYAAWKGLSARLPVFATWDDHDYFDNDLKGIPAGYTAEDQARVLEVFRRGWNNPSYGFGDGRGGVFLRTRIGPCDVLMTDNRYYHEPRKTVLGEDQMRWLETQLPDCKGPFIILSCGTMWSDYVSNGKDSWGQDDPDGRERILSLIEKRRIAGVLLVSGDRHGARGFRIPRPSGYSFYEFEPASLGGRSGPPATNPAWRDVQLFGISGKYAFGEFEADTAPADPEITFRLIGEDASVLYELKLRRSQLTPPPPGK